MAGTYMLGETKVRPGSYFNIQKKDRLPGLKTELLAYCSSLIGDH